MGTGRRSRAVVGAVTALLWAAAAAAGTAAPEPPAHAFSEVLFCQRDAPLSGLAQTLDDQPLFAFDFPGARWRPRLPDFQPEVRSRTAQANVSRQQELCARVLRTLTDLSVVTPEARGIPHVEIFTLQPLQLGKPNTLVCSVTNLFPPSANITWEHEGLLVTEGVYTPLTYPVQGLDFQAFSYLEVTPQESDVYSCTVKTPRDKSSTMAFWVPKDPIASDLPVNIACGVAAGVGVAFLIVGVALMVRSCRLSTTAPSAPAEPPPPRPPPVALRRDPAASPLPAQSPPEAAGRVRFARRLMTRSRAASALALGRTLRRGAGGPEAGRRRRPGLRRGAPRPLAPRRPRDAAEPPVLAGPLGSLPGARPPASRRLRPAPGDGLPALRRRPRAGGGLDAGLQQGALRLLRPPGPGVRALRPGLLRALGPRRQEPLRRPDPPVPGPRRGAAGSLPGADPVAVGPDGAQADPPKCPRLPRHPAEHAGARPAGLRRLGLLPRAREAVLAAERPPGGGRGGRAGALQQRGLDVPGQADPAGHPPAGRRLQLPRGARRPAGARHQGLGAGPAPGAPRESRLGSSSAGRGPRGPGHRHHPLEEAHPGRLRPY